MSTTETRTAIAVLPKQLTHEVEALTELIDRLRPVANSSIIWKLEAIRDRLEMIPVQNPTVEVPA